MAAGILAVGLLLVAGIFPVGIHLTAVSTETSTAAVIADEAFAKIRIYDVNHIDDDWPEDIDDPNVGDDFEKGVYFYQVMARADDLQLENSIEENALPTIFLYPSDHDPNADRSYCWSAIMRRIDPNDYTRIQATVFVSRRINAALEYETESGTWPEDMPEEYGEAEVDFSRWPQPILLTIDADDGENIIKATIENAGSDDEQVFITKDTILMDNETGKIYSVTDIIERDGSDLTIRLNKKWQGDSDDVWLVPPPIGGGRCPCIAVYQRILRL